MLASKDIQVGEQIAFLPASALLSESVCNESIIGQKIDEHLEKYPDQRSVLHLPVSYSMPLNWTDDQVQTYLKGTDLLHLTAEKKKWLQNALDISQQALSKIIPLNVLDWDNLLWAYSAISSRAFPRSSGTNGDRNELCLWTILDLMNHDHNSKIEWNITKEGVYFIAQEKTVAGCTLWNNYGPKGNEVRWIC